MEAWVHSLPAINASLNTVATLLLTAGFVLILRKQKVAHKRCMLSAFGVSTLFLALYLTHKFLKGYLGMDVNTPFPDIPFWRPFYLVMLATHVLLAMVVVPLILRTIYLGLKGREETHKKWARWTFPIWYYVSVTGVLVYFFLYQWFPSEGV
ncbi:MAG: DUF420 domain-containing protein [Opitutales bacterium]